MAVIAQPQENGQAVNTDGCKKRKEKKPVLSGLHGTNGLKLVS